MGANFWVSSHCNHWLLDKHELALTKHDLDRNGVTDDDLKIMRIFTAELAQILGTKLKLRQQIIGTAVIYIRRFYCKNSYGACHPLLLIATAMYLAIKVEEWGLINVRSIISATHQMVKHEFKYVYGKFDSHFPIEPKNVLDCEYYLLEELDCYMIVFHPYRPLLQYFNESNLKDRDLLQAAWYIINDSYRTDLCMLYPPYIIALAAINMACVIQDKDKRPEIKQWFAELSVDMNEVLEVHRTMIDCYQMWEKYDQHAVSAVVAKLPLPSNTITLKTQ